MNELSNTVSSVGNYNNVPTSLTSNTSAVNIVNGLTLTNEADKKNWSDGYLMYTVTLDNQTDTAYENPVVTDVIDTNLVEFVIGSVKINDVAATESQHSYNTNTHTLTVTLDKVDATSKVIITFNVKKKFNGFFILKSFADVKYDDDYELQSNYVYVTMMSPFKKSSKRNFGCSTPYWRY